MAARYELGSLENLVTSKLKVLHELKSPNIDKYNPEDSTNIVKNFVKDEYMYYLEDIKV